MSTDDKTKTKHQLAPEILRALTELFLTVENMAEVCLKMLYSVTLNWFLSCVGLGHVPGPDGGHDHSRRPQHMVGERDQ